MLAPRPAIPYPRVAGLLTAALIVAACAGVSPSPAAPAGASAASSAASGSSQAANLPDACTLLTKDDAAKILGEAASDPSPGLNATGSDESSCDWQQADQTSFQLKLVQLQVFVSTKYLPRDAYGTTGETVEDASVAGADEAFAVIKDRDVTLNAASGGRRIVLSFNPPKGKERESIPALSEAVATIIRRLG